MQYCAFYLIRKLIWVKTIEKFIHKKKIKYKLSYYTKETDSS